MVFDWRRAWPVPVYLAAIFVLSSIPALTAPGPEFSLKDELAHFGEYFILGVLLFRWLGWEISPMRWATFAFLVAVCATVGALDEIYQGYVPGRVMSIYDWLADIAGAAGGVGIFAFSGWGERYVPRVDGAPRGKGEEKQA